MDPQTSLFEGLKQKPADLPMMYIPRNNPSLQAPHSTATTVLMSRTYPPTKHTSVIKCGEQGRERR